MAGAELWEVMLIQGIRVLLSITAKTIAGELVGDQRAIRPGGQASGSDPGRQGDAGTKILEAEVGEGDQLPEHWLTEPWRKTTGKDQWALHLWEKGWMIRVHSVKQKRFQPLHETLPCGPEQLSQKRVTVAWLENGEKYILEDSWTNYGGASRL